MFSSGSAPEVKGYGIYNPHIHGTNSSVLALLPKTNFTLLSPVQMITQFQLAPMGGEIYRGGLDLIEAESGTAFGELCSLQSYGLEGIIRDYAKAGINKLPTKKELISKVKAPFQRGIDCCFSNINVLLVEIARSKQNGIANAEFATAKEIEGLLSNLEGTVQFYYLILLLGTKINPDYALLDRLEEGVKRDTTDAISTHLSFESILKKIISSKINLKSIYESGVESKELESVTELLCLPKTSVIKSGMAAQDKEVTVPEVKIFISTPPVYGTSYYYVPDYLAYRMAQNLSGYAINDFLEKFAKEKMSKELFDTLHASVHKRLPVLQNRIELLKTILRKEPSQAIGASSRSFLEKAFPIVLIGERSEKIELIDKQTGEFRAKTPLTLGQDIRVVATDSVAHRKVLLNYLQENNLDSVSVITFDQLRQSKHSGIDPVASIKKELAEKLSKYTARIESYKSPADGEKIDFSSGFWFFKQSRAINREANYLLAKKLLEDLNRPKNNCSSMFRDASQRRAEIIDQQGLFSRPDYKSRGMNSSELNSVLKAAI